MTANNETTLLLKPETQENPKMLQVYNDRVWHEAFCYAMVFEKNENKRAYDADGKLLMAIISGADTTLQAMKATIDMGIEVKFGFGEKGLSSYDFHKELNLSCEKGKYDKFHMSLNKNRKAVAIVHEDIVSAGKYVLSFEGNPAEDIAHLLGGSQYGLNILPEWQDTVFEQLIKEQYLVEHELYHDSELLDLRMYSIDLDEEQADRFISDLVQKGMLPFPKSESSIEADEQITPIHEINNLTSYLMNYNQAMAEKMNRMLIPSYNPLEEKPLEHYNSYSRELFPVQGHTASAISKRLVNQKGVVLQGEMSTGKSAMMTAIADGYSVLGTKKGYFAVLACPPSLTKKWPEEIRMLIPHAEIHVIMKTENLIRWHSEWIRAGRKKPLVPTFFIISFTTLRNDAAIRPAVEYKSLRFTGSKGEHLSDKAGIYCPKCGKPHQTIDSTTLVEKDGKQEKIHETHNMTRDEFGTGRRINSSVNPANAFCFYCGESLWTKTIKRRYSNFSQWAKKHEQKLIEAIYMGDRFRYQLIQEEQPELASSTSMPRRVATIEYIRRKMSGFFDIALIDEVHQLKGSNSAQGNALGSLVAASKKFIAGTGTLFGGKAEDIYYLWWRLFPQDMAGSGYEFNEVTRFNEEFGNVEETIYEPKESTVYSNKNSRGGSRTSRKKVIPGISSFIYGKYMVNNVVNVRLKDVWPDPVELVDTPTIFVDMTPEMKQHYNSMINKFENEINSRDDGFKLYSQMLDYGIGYPDNPFNFPDALYKNEKGERELIWRATHIPADQTTPKEAKLQEIVQTEMSEKRSCIVYVRDTGSTVASRDIRPRLKEKLEEIGAKVCILDTSTTKTNLRSDWLKGKIENEGYDVCIVSQKLVEVGLDLLCTPTLIYYQFSWSLYTINQSARRAWRIGQTRECRLYYLAYNDCYQSYIAEVIARKNKATAAINGEVSADGLSAMLGDEGDLQAMLIESVKQGNITMKGSAEEWIAQASDRARELLANIGKPRPVESTQPQKFATIPIENVEDGLFQSSSYDEELNLFTVAEIREKSPITNSKAKGRKKAINENQLEFDLFAM